MKMTAFDIEKGDIIKTNRPYGTRYVRVLDRGSANSVYADFCFEGVGVYGKEVDPNTFEETNKEYRYIFDILDDVELVMRA